MFLLDTNIVSELRKGTKAQAGVLAFARQHDLGHFYLSVITILELRMGILLLKRKDKVQARIMESWLDGQVLPRFDGRILPVNLEVAECCAHLHVPNHRQERDALIAATALVHKFVIVTRNERDFEPTGAKILNPWH